MPKSGTKRSSKPRSTHKSQKSKSRIAQQVKVSVGRGFFSSQFNSYLFIEAVMELIMNAFDWDATELIVQSSKDSITFTDNGVGMDENNRTAFCCINHSTAKSAGKLGKFDTGTKKLLFSHGGLVEVWTVPVDDPDNVYYFSLNSDSYEDMIWDGNKQITIEVWPKSQDWPSPFDHGSVIRYSQFKLTKGILSGEILRDAISARVASSRYHQIWVDGQTLEQREIHAKPFLMTEQDPRLGKITVELYRPTNRRQRDTVSLGALDIGMCKISDFKELIGSKDAARLPSVFSFQDVCGLLLFEGLSQFRAESSKTFDPRLNDSGLVELIIQFLIRIEERVRETLGLTRVQQDSEAFDSAVKVVYEVCHKAFNPGNEAPPVDNTPGQHNPDEDDADPDGPRPRNREPIKLYKPRREFSFGEKVVIRCGTNPKYVGDDEKVQWHIDLKSVADYEISKDTRTATLTIGNNPGSFSISASVIDKPSLIASQSYEVVAVRRMHLHSSTFHSKAGHLIIMTIHNSDLTSGQLCWQATGGTLASQMGARNDYTCGLIPGTFKVKVWDKNNPKISDEATIYIEHSEKRIRIREHWFRIQTFNLRAADASNDQMVFFREGTTTHDICVDSGAPTYMFATQQSSLAAMLLREIAYGYPKFVWSQLQEHGHETFNPDGLLQLMRNWEHEGSIILEELSRQLPKTDRS